MKKLYLAVTPDKYELPVAVADTAEGLADQIGTTKGTILSVISHAKQHKRRSVYHRLTYTERDWNDADM